MSNRCRSAQSSRPTLSNESTLNLSIIYEEYGNACVLSECISEAGRIKYVKHLSAYKVKNVLILNNN